MKYYENCYETVMGIKKVSPPDGAEKNMTHLASFPELIPDPVVETGLLGQIQYINPSAKDLFPDLEIKGFNHPWLSGLEKIADNFRKGKTEPVFREIMTGNFWYEQLIHYVQKERSIRLYGHDITHHKHAQSRQILITRILSMPNYFNKKSEIIEHILRLIKEFTGFDLVAICMSEGEDAPCYVHNEFPGNFVNQDRCNQTEGVIKDLEFYPEFICKNILPGKIRHILSFFKESRSFRINSTTEFLNSDVEDIKRATIEQCNRKGYESLALIPLYINGAIGGILQFNDRRPECFTDEIIDFFEEIASSITMALVKFQANELLHYRLEIENLVATISSHFINIKTSDIDRDINWALQAIGEFIRVDHCYICLFSGDLSEIEYVYGWCAEDMKSLAKYLRRSATVPFSGLIKKLKSSKTICFTHMYEDSPEDETEIKLLKSSGIKSLLAIPLQLDGSLIGVFGVSTVRRTKIFKEEDITLFKLLGEIFLNFLERHQMDENIRESEERLLMVLEGSNQGFWDWNIVTGEVKYSQSLLDMLGYCDEELHSHVNSWGKLIYPDDIPESERILDEHMKGLTDSYEREYRVLTKSGEWKWILDRGKIVARDEKGNPLRIAGTDTDISERKKIEKALKDSETEKSTILESLSDLVFFHDKDLRIRWVNRAVYDEFNLTPEELLGKYCYKIFHMRNKPCLNCPVLKAIETGQSQKLDIAMKDEKCWLVIASPVLDEHGYVTGAIETNLNMTELRRAEEELINYRAHLEEMVDERTKELIKLLQEKETLLQEIHHRVKNNLQIISSLLLLQASSIKDKSILNIFNESRNRIKSIAMVHEKLYQSKNFSRIDFSKYIKDLSSHLLITYNTSSSHIIRLNIKSEDIILNIKQAIPCGLIINELISNSMKYAFPYAVEGEILVEFYQEEGEKLILIVSDNGAGLPEDFSLENISTLGMELVVNLVDQLHGNIEIDRNSGTSFKISFLYSE
jgi:PAS domain S-box-containing protein